MHTIWQYLMQQNKNLKKQLASTYVYDFHDLRFFAICDSISKFLEGIDLGKQILSMRYKNVFLFQLFKKN